MAKGETVAIRDAGVEKGEVVDVTPSGCTVMVSGPESRSVECDTLVGPASVRPPSIGDVVLAWLPAEPHERGVILGLVNQTGAGEAPETLVLEAGKSLTLRVGDGSITIREDGKILIKGTHLVSHAKKLNRIRGGSVAIN